MKFNTIHLFGYGEGQIIGTDDNEKGFNKKKPLAELTTMKSFIDDLFTHQPEDNEAVKTDFHLINIFENGHVRFMAKTKTVGEGEAKEEVQVEGFQVPLKDLDPEKLEALVAELSA